MAENLKETKSALREEAKRARGLLTLDMSEYDAVSDNFFKSISVNEETVVGAYWPKGRELDTHLLIEQCMERGAKIGLPVVEKDSRLLKFARYDHDIEMVQGDFGILHPVLNKNTEWLDPDIFMVPLLAFDRSGYRLGYGGGYYDTTLAHYKEQRDGVVAVGLAYAKQACLFNLPRENHDQPMDWIITEQGALSFS